MALINDEKKEINAKIVYYGPGNSGKTTNVRFIYEKMKPEYRGKLKSLSTKSGNMLFFDFMRPDQMGIGGYDIRFHVYTIPGEVADYSIWKTVLKGVDGIVFVADSDPASLPENLQKFDELNRYIKTQGKELKDIPCLFQCNKEDIAGATTVEEMRELLHYPDAPMIAASAYKGDGVLNSLSTVVKMVLQTLRENPVDLDEGETAPVVPEEPQEPTLIEEPAFLEEPESPMLMPESEETKHAFSSDFDGITATDDVPEFAGLAEETKEAEVALTVPREDEAPTEAAMAFSYLGGLDSVQPPQFDMEEVQPTPENSASLEFSADFDGEIQQLEPGHLRLPLMIKYGNEIKKISINLKMSIDA